MGYTKQYYCDHCMRTSNTRDKWITVISMELRTSGEGTTKTRNCPAFPRDFCSLACLNKWIEQMFDDMGKKEND